MINYLYAVIVLLMFVSPAAAGDPNSVVDHFKSTGRDTSFDGRAKEYKKLYPDERYTGTAQQNERMLRVIRAGDVLTSYGESPRGVFQQPMFNSTQHDLTGVFNNWLPDRCRTIKVPASNWLERKADSLAQPSGSCCGPTFLCDHVPQDCYPYLKSDSAPCAKHDYTLKHECNAPWNQFSNACATSAHATFAQESQTRIGPVFRGLASFGEGYQAVNRAMETSGRAEMLNAAARARVPHVIFGTEPPPFSSFSQPQDSRPMIPPGYNWAK